MNQKNIIKNFKEKIQEAEVELRGTEHRSTINHIQGYNEGLKCAREMLKTILSKNEN